MGKLNRSHPDGVYKTFGTKSVHFLYAVEHLGLELIASTISKISSKNTVEFENGTMGDFDIILLNTGYQRSTFEGFCHDPIEEELHDKNLFEILKQASNVRHLYKRMMHPGMKNLFFVGFARPGFGSIPAIAELQARYAAALVANNGPKFPSEADMIASIAEDKAKDDAQFNGSAKRIVTLVDFVPFVNGIAALLGTSPPLFRYALTDPNFFGKLFVGPATVAQFRLRGPHAKPNIARNTIESYPLPTKRRLHVISLGLYLSSLIVLVLSLFIPLTSTTRKALMPVGFAPIQRGFIKRLRYLMGCTHIAALGYFYAQFFQMEVIGFALVFLTAAFEIIGLFKRAKYERELSVLLSSSSQKTFDNNLSSKTKNTNGRGTFTLLTAITKVLVLLGLQGSISQSLAFQSSFQATKASHRFNDCLKKVKNLKPLERVGLLANGNLQYLFSSYYDQPVDISITKFEKLEDEDDDQVLVAYDREVTMKIQGHRFCRAKSTLRVYSDETLEILSSSPIGIGQLFNLLEVLPKFTLLDVGRNEDGSLWRSYSLQSDKHLQCVILEKFTADAWSLDMNVTNKSY